MPILAFYGPDSMKVLLIDDHPLILAALENVIQGLGRDVSVVTASSAQEARDKLASEDVFDLVLLDLHLGDADGFDVLAEFRSNYPTLPVVVISASDRSSDVIRAIDMGAMGFVPKRSSNETLFEALHMVMSGGIYVPSMSLGLTERASSRRGVVEGAAVPIDPTAMGQPNLEALKLTPRQTDVLALMLQGQPNKMIARELKLSVETVKDHVAAVLRALNVSSRTQAVLAVSQISSSAPAAPYWRKEFTDE
jgi:DNA-binding NarL/FixJ family response regulator